MMSEEGVMPLEVVVDDCWNRIGTRGDGSCPDLPGYLRCLNCPVFAAGASRLLDRATEPAQHLDAAQAQPMAQPSSSQVQGSILIFRIGVEWLGLPTSAIVEVIETRAIHSLPHQSNPAVLGLTNIRGALKICVALAGMLGSSSEAPLGKRALVVEHEQQVLVFPVDDVAGVHAYRADALLALPSTLQGSASAYSSAVIAWRMKKVGLLDCGRLFYAVHRSLI